MAHLEFLFLPLLLDNPPHPIFTKIVNTDLLTPVTDTSSDHLEPCTLTFLDLKLACEPDFHQNACRP